MKPKKKLHIFSLLTIHDLLITKSIILNHLKNEDYIIFYLGEKNLVHLEWYGADYNKIIFTENKYFYSRIKIFNKINKTITKNKDRKIYFYASTYVNFISNYFFRFKNIKKVLISHGISNYILPEHDFSARGYINPFFFLKKVIIFYFHYLTSFKQLVQLLMCGKIYDFFYNHSSAYNKILYDKGYFFSLENLITKTQNDIEVNIVTNENNLNIDKCILFLEELHAPSRKNPVINNKILEYLKKNSDYTVIYKPHPNMMNIKIENRLPINNKIIHIASVIPAEYYISKNQVTTVLGGLSSTLIYNKLINKNNTSILYDDQEANIAHSYLLRKFNVNIIQLL